MQSPTNPNADTAPTKAPGIDWRIWYTLAIIGISFAAGRGSFPEVLYLIVINWLLWFIPVWLVVRLVRRIRRK